MSLILGWWRILELKKGLKRLMAFIFIGIQIGYCKRRKWWPGWLFIFLAHTLLVEFFSFTNNLYNWSLLVWGCGLSAFRMQMKMVKGERKDRQSSIEVDKGIPSYSIQYYPRFTWAIILILMSVHSFMCMKAGFLSHDRWDCCGRWREGNSDI